MQSEGHVSRLSARDYFNTVCREHVPPLSKRDVLCFMVEAQRYEYENKAKRLLTSEERSALLSRLLGNLQREFPAETLAAGFTNPPVLFQREAIFGEWRKWYSGIPRLPNPLPDREKAALQLFREVHAVAVSEGWAKIDPVRIAAVVNEAARSAAPGENGKIGGGLAWLFVVNGIPGSEWQKRNGSEVWRATATAPMPWKLGKDGKLYPDKRKLQKRIEPSSGRRKHKRMILERVRFEDSVERTSPDPGAHPILQAEETESLRRAKDAVDVYRALLSRSKAVCAARKFAPELGSGLRGEQEISAQEIAAEAGLSPSALNAAWKRVQEEIDNLPEVAEHRRRFGSES